MWDVERKWTASAKLKADFKRIRKELEMNNQVVEEFLQEAIIMKRFNHPNVMLFQCGISPFTSESFPNKFRIWNNSSSWFMCNTSKIC